MNDFVGPDEHIELPVDFGGRDFVDEQVWVSFSIVGDDFDPDEVTARTGLSGWARGDKRPRQPPITFAGRTIHPPSAVWFVAVRAAPDEILLDAAADRLLAALEPHASFLIALARVRRIFEVRTVLGTEPEWMGEFTPEVLRRIAALGATLHMEVSCGRCY